VQVLGQPFGVAARGFQAGVQLLDFALLEPMVELEKASRRVGKRAARRDFLPQQMRFKRVLGDVDP
jgi:hypothetical protein